jgi:hypothetical protein
MHGYPLYAEWADGPTDATLLPSWLYYPLARWKDVLFQEYGAPSVDRDCPAGSASAVLSFSMTTLSRSI